ncbi:hypothetical protein RIVM261_075430 [Rivularia sp. IAM M-261]|nr:hypothetical protein RIVM261_075430 [Rivularia sp. IAM M-261]
MASKFWQDFNNILETVVPGYSLLESVVDNYIRDTASPIPGSILYCSLFGAEHTGIYIGDGQIVELQGKLSNDSGAIRVTNKGGFISGTNAITIYVACHGDGSNPIGSDVVAQRAKEVVGQKKNYHLLKNNCHMFTSGCITGNFNNSDNLFIDLKNTIRRNYGEFNWRAWS